LLRSRCTSSFFGSSPLSKYLASGQTRTRVARGGFADTELLGHIATCERERGHLPFAVHRDDELLRQRVGHAHADTVQTTGEAVGVAAAFVELAAGMQPRVHDLEHRHALFRVQPERNAAAVVIDADRAVAVQRQRDALAETGQRFVGRVVDHFLDRVQRAVGARVHARPLLHRLEAFQNTDRVFGVLRGLLGAGHGEGFYGRPA
jgi:hypothetical protein